MDPRSSHTDSQVGWAAVCEDHPTPREPRMPVDPTLTPRQLRMIADRVEALTKARHNNQAMGVPTTPDRFECRFPSGHRGTVQWTEAPLTSAQARQRNGGKSVFRYVVQLHDLRPDDVQVTLSPVPDETLARLARVATRDATAG